MDIFVDMDGVLADFEKYFEDHYGFRHDSVPDEEMWKLINEHENFFGSLPPMPNAILFFNDLQYKLPLATEISVLTACPKTNYQKSALQKKAWANKYLGRSKVFPVLGGHNKGLFMFEEGDILIDDFDKNIKAWNRYGGKGILHTNFQTTAYFINELFGREYLNPYDYI